MHRLVYSLLMAATVGTVALYAGGCNEIRGRLADMRGGGDGDDGYSRDDEDRGGFDLYGEHRAHLRKRHR